MKLFGIVSILSLSAVAQKSQKRAFEFAWGDARGGPVLVDRLVDSVEHADTIQAWEDFCALQSGNGIHVYPSGTECTGPGCDDGDATEAQCNHAGRGSVNADIFAPYGDGVHTPYSTADFDFQVQNGGNRCDDCSQQIILDQNFKFFGTDHNDAFVSSNGVVSFGAGVSDYTPEPFPLVGTPMFSPFWGDVDLEVGGRIFYRQVTKGDSVADDADLELVNQMVRDASASLASTSVNDATYFNNIDLDWALIATWSKTGFFGGYCADRINTFQVILTQDDTGHYVIFNYGDIEWGTGTASDGNACSGQGGTPAQAGFNDGTGNADGHHTLTLSRTDGVVDIEKTTNVNRIGRYIFTVGEEIVAPAEYIRPIDLADAQQKSENEGKFYRKGTCQGQTSHGKTRAEICNADHTSTADAGTLLFDNNGDEYYCFCDKMASEAHFGDACGDYWAYCGDVSDWKTREAITYDNGADFLEDCFHDCKAVYDKPKYAGWTIQKITRGPNDLEACHSVSCTSREQWDEDAGTYPSWKGHIGVPIHVKRLQCYVRACQEFRYDRKTLVRVRPYGFMKCYRSLKKKRGRGSQLGGVCDVHTPVHLINKAERAGAVGDLIRAPEEQACCFDLLREKDTRENGKRFPQVCSADLDADDDSVDEILAKHRLFDGHRPFQCARKALKFLNFCSDQTCAVAATAKLFFTRGPRITAVIDNADRLATRNRDRESEADLEDAMDIRRAGGTPDKRPDQSGR